jgi:uncharacterized membrane protein
MADSRIDSIDHDLIAQQSAALTHSSAKNSGLLFVAVAVVSFVVCLASFATRHVDMGVSAASITLLAAGASLASRATEIRRLRQVQRDWQNTRHGVAQ